MSIDNIIFDEWFEEEEIAEDINLDDFESDIKVCQACGATIIDGAVSQCLGDGTSCSNYSYEEGIFDIPAEQELDFSDKPDLYYDAQLEDSTDDI